MRRASVDAAAGAPAGVENRTAAAGGAGGAAGASISIGFLVSEFGRRLTSTVKDFEGLRMGALRADAELSAESAIASIQLSCMQRPVRQRAQEEPQAAPIRPLRTRRSWSTMLSVRSASRARSSRSLAQAIAAHRRR